MCYFLLANIKALMERNIFVKYCQKNNEERKTKKYFIMESVKYILIGKRYKKKRLLKRVQLFASWQDYQGRRF